MSRTQPIALFMAFGTKGDVHPIAAIAAAFSCDQKQYQVVLMTHAAHEDLCSNLGTKNVEFHLVMSPPFLSAYENSETAGVKNVSFSMKKRELKRKHRAECINTVERIFGDGPSMEGDFIVINFFAMEGWSLAELFNIRCFVASPYVVPYSAPSSFEHQFKEELPLLYKCFQEASTDKVCWHDVIHWMWPLFMDDWDIWRSSYLNLSPCPFTDPVTGLPTWHDMPDSPLLLYGFSKEIVECPGYWPSSTQICGFWFLPPEWQFSCIKCRENMSLYSSRNLYAKTELCSAHTELQLFLMSSTSLLPPFFIGFSSVGSMGFMKNPGAFINVLREVLRISPYRFILFTTGYKPLDRAIRDIDTISSSSLEQGKLRKDEDGISLFGGRLYCFSSSIPYSWLFPRCSAAIHHGGSGSTAAALHAGIPQVVCPFMMDQFYWGERIFWLGVSPEPINRRHLLPDDFDEISIKESAKVVATALDSALSPEIKARASEIAEKLSHEDGVSVAVKALKEKLSSS